MYNLSHSGAGVGPIWLSGDERSRSGRRIRGTGVAYQEGAVMIVGGLRMTSIVDVMTVGYDFLGWYHNGMFTPSGWASMTRVG